MGQYKVLKSLNNNVVLASYLEKFYIIIAKGIGYDVQSGTVIDRPQDAHYYLLQDESQLSVYEKLIIDTDEKVLFATEKAIRFAEKQLKYKFDQSIHISLLDHLNFAIYRYSQNVEIGSYISDSYTYLYRELHDLSLSMLAMINKDLDIDLPKSEAGAIVLHLHAALRKDDLSKHALQSQIIGDAIDMILNEIEGENASDVAKARLATHLKFALVRHDKGESIEGFSKDMLDKSYTRYYKIAQDVCLMIEKKYNIKLPQEEILYIALHIRNL